MWCLVGEMSSNRLRYGMYVSSRGVMILLFLRVHRQARPVSACCLFFFFQRTQQRQKRCELQNVVVRKFAVFF